MNASTVLSGSTNGQQFRVVNLSTGSAATGIGIHTDVSRPPLAVNSSKKVTNLNVDLFDGKDSSVFQQKLSSQCANGTAIATINPDGSVGCTNSAVHQISHTITPATLHIGPVPRPARHVKNDTCAYQLG